MARRLGKSFSKTAALMGFSWNAVVSIYQKCSKKVTVVNKRQSDAGGEWRLARVVRPLSTAKSTNYGHVSSRTGPWSNGRRWSGLMNPIFFHITWMASCAWVAYLYTLSWKQYSLAAVASFSRITPQSKQIGSMGAPPQNLRDWKDLLLVQIPQHTFRVLVDSMPQWVRAILAAKGGPTQN